MKILVLYCGGGGCCEGYSRAGFDVLGIDIDPQPSYRHEFLQMDALSVHPMSTMVREADAVHASPPCQFATAMSNRWRGKGGKTDDAVNLIPQTRALLQSFGKPYVIENVIAARSHLIDPVTLNGGMFGLKVDRPRLFETNWPLIVPQRVPVDNPIGVYGKAHDGRRLFTRSDGSEQRCASSLEEAQAAMGIDWMPWRELTQAIPPAYCELIGHQLATYLAGVPA